MESTMYVRAFEKSDAVYLEDIIRKTWNYDKFCSPKVARKMSKIYLLSCLANQSFTQVALMNDIPVGIIMGKDRRVKSSMLYQLRMIWHGILLMCNREGRGVLKAYTKIAHLDEDLLKESEKKYLGEVAFFALDESCRGKGIGKELFTKLLQYMRKQDINSFFLFTDSSCNFGFYEHQGMKRCGEKEFAVPIGLDNKMRFFIYEYEMGI